MVMGLVLKVTFRIIVGARDSQEYGFWLVLEMAPCAMWVLSQMFSTRKFQRTI